jgi:hypothetical protein
LADGINASHKIVKHYFPIICILSFISLGCPGISAQELDQQSKIEVGAEFSTLTVGPSRPRDAIAPEFTALRHRREPGFGGRFTFNLNRHLAVEDEVNFFPRNDLTGGSVIQELVGIKAGRRFKRIGVFGKARPGFLSFSDVTTEEGVDTVGQPPLQFTVPHFEVRRRNFFAMDVGAVLEIYHSRRIFTRVDFGDTIVRYGKGLFFDSDERTPQSPAQTRHAFQFSAGIGFRFR